MRRAPEPGGVGVVEGVAGNVAVGAVGDVLQRVDGEELTGAGVVVAGAEVDQPSGIGVFAGEPERGQCGVSSTGFDGGCELPRSGLLGVGVGSVALFVLDGWDEAELAV